MNSLSKVAEGLAGWLSFEVRSGRRALFSESYMRYPLGQLLSYRFSPSRVIPEVPHPVLSQYKEGPGRKPSIDFVVRGEAGPWDLAVEAKWASGGSTLLRDMLRDIVRLELLVPSYAKRAALVLAGRRRYIEDVFKHPSFQPHPNQQGSHTILPLGNRARGSVRFVPVPKFRRKLYARTLEPFRGIPISASTRIERSGPFPKVARTTDYVVYIWRVLRYHESLVRIEPESFYDLSQGGDL